jgi:hypothetical protein
MDTYLHDIASLRSKHEELPAVLADIDLNRGIRAGDPVDHVDLVNARSAAATLKAVRSEVYGSADWS